MSQELKCLPRDGPARYDSEAVSALPRQSVDQLDKAKRAQRMLQQYRFAFDQHAIVTVTDLDGRITYANDMFCAISGYAREELIGQTHQIIRSGVQPPSIFANLWRTIQRGEVWHGEMCNRPKSGPLYWVSATIVPLCDEQGQPEQYIAIRTDITALKNIEFRLNQAKQVSEDANHAKSVFLANMSHEIRTPLNALLGMAQVLERTALDAEQAEMVGRIRSAGNVLLDQLNDVLDLSKIESGQIELERHSFQLTDLLADLNRLMVGAAREKNLTLTVQAPQGLTQFLVGDSKRLSQILINLVGNSIKFTSRGSITVTVQRLGHGDGGCWLGFEVLDTGIGIPADRVAELFKPFTQADSSVTRRFGGTGLGLSICKNLVELMGGKMGAENRAHGGSRFWFKLPFALTSQGPESTPQTSPSASEATGPRLTGRHFLIVDDNEMNRLTIDRMLRLEGATSSQAENGQQAIDLLRRQPDAFDAVLMDVQMPVLDGLQATKHLRTQLNLTALPVLICSAGVHTKERAQALASGANDFIVKPIVLNTMVAQLLRVLQAPAPVARESAVVTPPCDSSEQPPCGPDVWPEIAGIAGEQMREQHGGDLKFFLLLLRMLSDELQLALQELPQQLGTDQGGAERVHKLRGSAGAVGALALVPVCRALEDAIHQGGPEQAACLRRFEDEARALLQAMAPHLKA